MTSLDPKVCYEALATRDVRFDGPLFVGVTSTGIYCRTSERLCGAAPAGFPDAAEIAAADLAALGIPASRCEAVLALARAALSDPRRFDPAVTDPDAFSASDAALARRAEAWRPWRAYAVQHLRRLHDRPDLEDLDDLERRSVSQAP